MKEKHGLSQYRINHARDYAKYILESVAKVELLFHLSQEGHIEEQKAENGIANTVKEIERSTKELLVYIEQRDDMR
jgi:formamidopyrimidine-DNA glycosylase